MRSDARKRHHEETTMSTENIDLYRVDQTNTHTWVTDSDIRWVLSSAEKVTDALANLVFELQALDVEPYVTHLHLEVSEDGPGITVGALVERGHDEAKAL